MLYIRGGFRGGRTRHAPPLFFAEIGHRAWKKDSRTRSNFTENGQKIAPGPFLCAHIYLRTRSISPPSRCKFALLLWTAISRIDRAPDFVLVPQAKRMHQIVRINFENYKFSPLLRGHIPLRHPLSRQAPKFCQSLIWAPPLS